MHPHSGLIANLGGYAVVAEALKLEPNVIWNWCKRGVPWKWRNAVAGLANARGLTLPGEFLPPEAESLPQSGEAAA